MDKNAGANAIKTVAMYHIGQLETFQCTVMTNTVSIYCDGQDVFQTILMYCVGQDVYKNSLIVP